MTFLCAFNFQKVVKISDPKNDIDLDFSAFSVKWYGHLITSCIISLLAKGKMSCSGGAVSWFDCHSNGEIWRWDWQWQIESVVMAASVKSTDFLCSFPICKFSSYGQSSAWEGWYILWFLVIELRSSSPSGLD